MVLDTEVQMKVNSRTVKLYEGKGYKIPMRIGSHNKLVYDDSKYFSVKIEDLEPTSTVLVNTTCDICGVKKLMPYREYYRQLDDVGLRTCMKCKTIKYKKTIKEKYGENIESTTQLDFVKEKIKKLNLERYGVEWCMENKEIQEKRKNTFLEKYGFEWAIQNDEIQNKKKMTNLKKYGFDNPAMNKKVIEKQKKTMIDKYGVDNPMHSPEIKSKIQSTNLKRYNCISPFGSKEVIEKSRMSQFKNNTAPISIQQKYICNLYHGILNYPCSNFSLDIIKDNIDIEYDGKGHNLSVILGNISQEGFLRKTIIRDKIVKSYGYKIMKLISSTDKLPSDEILLYILNFTKEYFEKTTHTWFEWYFDENKYKNAEHKDGKYFNFGELKRISKESA